MPPTPAATLDAANQGAWSTVKPTLDESWTSRIPALYGLAAPRIVLADGDDPRARSACGGLLEAGLQPVLLGTSRAHLPQEVDYICISEPPLEPVAKTLGEVGERQRWDDDRLQRSLHDPQYVAAAMVRAGQADAALGGATRPSGDVIRAALRVIGLRPNVGLLTSSFMMELESGRRLAFADCAVVPEPDVAQLAEIAISTAEAYRKLTDDEPVVAMLSFSTHGSASHRQVDLVRDATEKVHELRPDLAVDGDLQFDAAYVEAVGATKCAGSLVAGHANVFVFPDLAAGNIGYKIAQWLGHAHAYGPILQGLSAPMNDLSRGCSSRDIVSMSLVGALQAA